MSVLRTPSRGPAVPVPPAATLRAARTDGATGPALRRLDLEIAAGERLVLLGPPGAGSSIVLDVLAGFIPLTSGQLLLDGRLVAEMPPHPRGIGLVLRNDGPLAHLTVAGTVGFAATARGGGREAAADILQAFNLTGLARRRAGNLSPEQRVRTALARALAGRPRLVLLDDPFAALAAPARDAVLDELLPALAASGAAAVLATTEPALALAFSERAAALEDGRVVQTGPVQTLYDAPANAAVARLLGEANCLPGRVTGVDGDVALVRLDCGLEVEADPAGAVAGRECLVFIRPGRIAVAAITAEEMGQGALPAVVTGLTWQGDHVRLTLAIGTAAPATLVVTRPASASLAGFSPGRTAAVAWQGRHARVLS